MSQNESKNGAPATDPQGRLDAFVGRSFPAFNQENAWVQSPRWKKRIQGFLSYQVCSFMALWHPEAVDTALFLDLRDEFVD